MKSGMVAYSHPSLGFTLPLPAEWEVLEEAEPGVALIAREPQQRGGFRTNLVVTVEAVPTELDLEGWQTSAEEQLPGTLRGYILLDHERLEIDGRSALRRLAHHARPDAGSITMEQWAALVGGRGVTVTASCATFEYDALAPMFTAIAAQVRFPPATFDHPR